MNDRTTKAVKWNKPKLKYNAKLFFKKAIVWYKNLLLALRWNIPKKGALQTTIKNLF